MPMELLVKKVQNTFQEMPFHFSIVDVEGKVLFSTTSKETPFNMQSLLETNTLDIFELKSNDLLAGYIIFHDILAEREKIIIRHYLQDIHTHIDRELSIILQESRETFWKNVLYGNLSEEEYHLYMDKFNIPKSSVYAHAVLKITPPFDIQKEDLECISSVLKQYIENYASIHTHVVGDGEVVLLFEYTYTTESPVAKIKNQLKVYGSDIIKQLKHHDNFAKRCIIIGVSEHEYYIESLSEAFMALRDFVRTAYQLHKKSLMIFYENKPIYMLLNQIPPLRAEGYVNMVFRDLDKKHGDPIQSLKALFDNDLNVSRAATSLHVHRHTLEYRLHAIQRATEADPLKFHNALQFALAILLKELYDL